MRNFLFFLCCALSALFLTSGLSAQNLVNNPSFETTTGVPASIPAGAVSDWQSVVIGSGAVPKVFSMFPTCTHAPAPAGTNFAVPGAPSIPGPIPNTGSTVAIINRLARPLIPAQRLTINFQARLPGGCSGLTASVEIFAVNNPSTFNVNTAIPMAQAFVPVGSGGWQTINAFPFGGTVNMPILVPPAPPGACSFSHLAIIYRAGNSTDLLYLDDIHVEPCTATLGATATAQNDQNGNCNEVLFTANPGQGQQNCFWNFGDGTTGCSTTPTITHTYANMGNYVATVTVMDAAGCIQIVPINVTVACQRCKGIAANFNTTCLTCYPMYEGEPGGGPSKLVGYTCFYNFQDLSTPSNLSVLNSWSWTFNGTVFSTQQNPSNVALTVAVGPGGSVPPSQVCLTVTDWNGCQTRYCQTINVPCHGAREAEAPLLADFQVSPNPSATGLLSLRCSEALEAQDRQVSVFDLQGQLVRAFELPAYETGAELDLSALPGGVYVISLRHAAGILSQKVVLEK